MRFTTGWAGREGLQPGFQGLAQPLADECAEVIHQRVIGVKDQPTEDGLRISTR